MWFLGVICTGLFTIMVWIHQSTVDEKMQRLVSAQLFITISDIIFADLHVKSTALRISRSKFTSFKAEKTEKAIQLLWTSNRFWLVNNEGF